MKAFGPFRLDTVNHSLWRADERTSLTPKAFDVLRYLVEHADRLVTQDELLESLWPETYVNPEGIRKYILEVRRALGDRSGKPVFIQTFPKRGYQFVAAVTESGTAPVLAASTQPTTSMVGRQDGLARLNAGLQAALTGQRQMVFVTGEAGIGKTTLVDAFEQQVCRRPDLRIARGQCIEGFGGIEAYYPMLEAIGSLIRSEETGALIQAFTKRAPTWLIQFPGLVKPEQREALQREILGSTRERMVRELCEVLESISAQTPLLVILEDLHWVDPSTLDLISAFARRRDPAKVLLLGTYRPVDVVLSQSPLKNLKQDLLVHRLCHEIALEALDEPDVADYLARTFHADSVPSTLANLIHQNSGGNPLFLAAIVRDMANRGFIAADQGRLILAAPIEQVYPGIPETLHQMLQIQLEQLSPDDLRILQAGSIAGERFSVWAAAAMLDSSPASIEEKCEKLANRQQFIQPAGIHKAASGALSAHFEFRHSLYRQALYRSLSGLNQAQLHLALGERLRLVYEAGRPEIASELALHLEKGRDYEGAARCLMLAAQNAANRFSHRAAIQILRRALELLPALAREPGLEMEIQILLLIGDTQFVLHEMSDSAASYQAAVDRAARAGLKTAQTEAFVRLASPVLYLDAARGSEVCKQALELCATLDDPLTAAHMRLTLGGLLLLFDEWRREEVEVCANALETIRRISGSSVVHHVLYFHIQAFQGDYEDAHRETDALINTTANPAVYAVACSAKGVILLLQGRFGEMLQIVRTGRELAEKNGEDPWMYIFGEAWLRMECFDFNGAQRLSNIVVRSNGEPHTARLKVISRMACGYAALGEGNHAEALQCFTQVRDPRITPKFFIHWHFRLHAQIGIIEAWLQAAGLAEAHREADDLLAAALSGADPNMRALAWEIKSRVARAEGDLSRARACMDQALAILDNFEIPAAAWQVHRTAGDLFAYEGDHQRAEAHWAQAKEVIMSIADSFAPDEPLRESLLAAPAVRRVLVEAPEGQRPWVPILTV
jgi:DNA-binding winged helix-turn-helix (wHTH) protein/tetratricopeptide (TPR) repeat protein